MTISLIQLWIPILASSVIAWLASGLIHMLIKYHNSDYQKLENEDEVMAAVRQGSPSRVFITFHTVQTCRRWPTRTCNKK